MRHKYKSSQVTMESTVESMGPSFKSSSLSLGPMSISQPRNHQHHSHSHSHRHRHHCKHQSSSAPSLSGPMSSVYLWGFISLITVLLPICLWSQSVLAKSNSTETLIRDIMLNQSSAWYDEAAIEKWLEKETEAANNAASNVTELQKAKRTTEIKESYMILLATLQNTTGTNNATDLYRLLQQKIGNFTGGQNQTTDGKYGPPEPGTTYTGFNYTTVMGSRANYSTTNYSIYANKPDDIQSKSSDSTTTAKRSINDREHPPQSLPMIDASGASVAAPSSDLSAINEFPPDFLSDKVRQNGGFVVHILIFIYLSMALAVICDSYFLKSLEYISEALSLPADIAGATFMAIGTSAPELFTSVIGVFISDNDIGTGTIVGSAVFNLIAIPSACGFAAYYNLAEMPKISSFPIVRDTIFYVLTIITLILCIKDNKVDWIESLTLLALYCVYIVIMYFNAQVSHLIENSDVKLFSRSSSSDSVNGGKGKSSGSPHHQSHFTHNCSSGGGGSDSAKAQRQKRRSSANDQLADERRPLLMIEPTVDSMKSKSSSQRNSPPPAYQATGCTYHQHLQNPFESKKSDQHFDGPETQHFPVDPSQIQLVMGDNGKLKEAKLSLYPKASASLTDLNSMDCICYSPLDSKKKMSSEKAAAAAAAAADCHHYDGDDELDLDGKRQRQRKAKDLEMDGVMGLGDNRKVDQDDDEEEDDWTENVIIKVLLIPFRILFLFTLPRPTRFCFVLTFISSICWIAALTYFIVWMVTLVGYTLGIPDTVSGITVLAAGTSIPELISSYLIVKKAGLADMAICNSIGSNIFDILFCLGLPWLLKTFIVIVTNGFGFSTLAASSIPIQSTALPLTSLTLLITIGAMLGIFKITRWRLCLQTGILCLIVYVIFVITSTLLEFNV